MARYKLIDRNPNFIPVVLDAQLIAGSFEYALEYLIALVLVIVTRFPRCPLRFLTNPERTGAQNQVHMLQRLKDMNPACTMLRINNEHLTVSSITAASYAHCVAHP